MRRRWLSWIVSGLVVVSVAGSYHKATALQQSSVAAAPAVSPHSRFINQYCVTCHNEKARTAGLALDTMDVENIGANPEVWEKVVQKLLARTMPPAGRARPDDSGYDEFVSYLETSLDRAAQASPNPGRTETFHRLNRSEYQNAIRDLLALDLDDVAALLPKDDESYGFDNVNVGTLPPVLMERFVSAAQKISQRALGSSGRAQGPAIIELAPDLTQEQELEGMPPGTRGGTVFRHTFPLDGEYEFEIRLSRDRDEHIEGLSEPHEMELSLDGARVRLVTVKPEVSNADPDYRAADEGVFTFRVPVKAGPREVGVAFLSRPSALSEQDREPFLASFNIYRHPRMQPAIYRVSIAGPFNPGGPGDTPSRRKILVCHPTKPAEEVGCASTILSTLVRRAYRRPPTSEDLQVLLGFYKSGRAEGGFDDGIASALSALLVSPEFLFRIETDPANIASKTAYRISALALASRLSFFLWSSIPDDELLNAAVDGTLRQPAVLEKQVLRMLRDDRSHALVDNFAGQWLQLRNLEAVNRSPRLFPDFDDNLRQALRRETELFFQSIVDEDRSALDLLRADYTFLNERLAKHYGIPNVYGSRFRRVILDKDSPRGGLLGQGSFLAVTSYPTRTAPTLRGKWILENILGSPPPPAPPNIPALKDDASEDKVLSMRGRMAQHRNNPSCAGCHQMMDPLGFGLENFDAVGRWRSQEDGTSIDASGALPDGVTFEGAAGLKRSLLNRPEPFLTTMTGKLLTYALGRGVEYYDAPAIRKIVRDAGSNDYRFSSFVVGIVGSTPFQMRNSQ